MAGSRPRAGRITNTGPGPGAGIDRRPERASIIHARIAIVATIVVGQLWALTVALNAYFEGETRTVLALLGFQATSFVLALAVWIAGPKPR